VYFLVWCLGAGGQSITFATYNAVDYFNYFFPFYDPLFYFGLVLAIALPLGVGTTLLYKPKSYKTLVFFYSGMGIFVALQCIACTLIGYDVISAKLGYALAIVFLSFASILQSIADGILYDFLGLGFPAKAIQAVQSGGTICFMLTFVVRVIAKLIVPPTRTGFVLSGFIYFGFIVAVEILCACIIAYIKPMFPENLHTHVQDGTGEHQPLLGASGTTAPHIKVVIRMMWPLMIFLGSILLVTHSIYPGITSVFHSGEGPASSGWFVVILFGGFSVGDFVGKNLPLAKKLYTHRTVWVGLALHVAVCVFSMLGMQRKIAPHVFDSDAYAIALIAVLGVSNGYIMVCGYMSLPEVLPEEHRGKGSSAALFAVYCGLLGGTLSSILIHYILVQTHFASS